MNLMYWMSGGGGKYRGNDVHAVAFCRNERITLDDVNILEAQIARDVVEENLVIEFLVWQSHLAFAQDCAICRPGSGISVCSGQGCCDATVLNVVKSSGRTNAMGQLVVELASTWNEGWRNWVVDISVAEEIVVVGIERIVGVDGLVGLMPASD